MWIDLDFTLKKINLKIPLVDTKLTNGEKEKQPTI